MLWRILKKSTLDLSEEILYLVIFNVFWLIGTVLILPFPLVTFALFHTVYDIGQGKGIKMGTFVTYARQTWKQAYIWGAINLVVLLVARINLSFYAGIDAGWAAVVQTVVIAITFFWLILQLLILPLYPRLTNPGFRLALRNAAAMIGLQPLIVFSLVILTGLIGLLSFFFQAIALIGSFSIIAVVANRTVQAILEKALGPQPDSLPGDGPGRND